jgi:hypothetical protein
MRVLQIVELRPVTAGVPANGQRTRRAARLSDSKKFSSNAIQLPGVRLLEHQIRAMPSALRFSGKSVVIDPGEFAQPTVADEYILTSYHEGITQLIALASNSLRSRPEPENRMKFLP